ncbi:RNA-binding protein [Streptococcus pluranimalium]|uniref:RNA-binding protein n=1 Tax=Streptococcus pluranimalium TaxID=82348 RepID=A0A2L0D6F8_9STRE|nr:RNA-binding protein [Streptococcus pluranimalium]AUW97387.1 RNA-binding protein [Streptococcus pluranimalium]HEN8023713.1 RNA-binding protein [Streptococcus agalactiae]
MTIVSWFIILFAGFLYLALRISEIKEKQKQAQILQLNFPTITADIEQVIEESATVSGQKLLFDSRYIRFLQSSNDNRSHLVSFPIMLPKKPDINEESYIQQVFLTQFSKYLAESTTYDRWSNKGQSLYVTPQFRKLLRYNNQYYLNLEIQFSYSSN